MRRRIKAWQDAQHYGPPRGKHLLDAYTKGNTAQLKNASPIGLPRYVVGVLLQRKEAAGKKGQGFAFANSKGGHFTTSNFRRSWNGARAFDAQNGDDFTWISPKSMRKSAATLVARTSGLQAAAYQLLHSSPDITPKNSTSSNSRRWWTTVQPSTGFSSMKTA